MSKWVIDKEFHFEMGHRVWAQKLDHPDLSISTDCACKHLHGHSYTIKVFLASDHLDPSAMVTDFKNLNFMKKFVDEVLDHKFMIDVNDPQFCRITGLTEEDRHSVQLATDFMSASRWFGSKYPNDEFLESFVIVKFVPTSENICKHLKLYAQSMIGKIATVEAVELWETKKSHCRYED